MDNHAGRSVLCVLADPHIDPNENVVVQDLTLDAGLIGLRVRGGTDRLL